MKPGSASNIVTAIRLANALPFAESILALAIAYTAKLTPDCCVEPTAFYIGNHMAVARDVIAEVNEQQFITTDVVDSQAKQIFVARCLASFNPQFAPCTLEATTGWTADTWVAYGRVVEVLTSEFGTAQGA